MRVQLSDAIIATLGWWKSIPRKSIDKMDTLHQKGSFRHLINRFPHGSLLD